MANENKTYTIEKTSFTHGAEVMIKKYESNKHYVGCAGTITGLYCEYAYGHETLYFCVSLGPVSIHCRYFEVEALGLRRVVTEQHKIVADGRR